MVPRYLEEFSPEFRYPQRPSPSLFRQFLAIPLPMNPQQSLVVLHHHHRHRRLLVLRPSNLGLLLWTMMILPALLLHPWLATVPPVPKKLMMIMMMVPTVSAIPHPLTLTEVHCFHLQACHRHYQTQRSKQRRQQKRNNLFHCLFDCYLQLFHRRLDPFRRRRRRCRCRHLHLHLYLHLLCLFRRLFSTTSSLLPWAWWDQ
mmetsp:Transcript_27775/g.67102  ORF Transcript_27775/g.67102 Transcript_27775/m.67102 type:complete len:201 (+) Transcript_27775:3933-4535(+)